MRLVFPDSPAARAFVAALARSIGDVGIAQVPASAEVVDHEARLLFHERAVAFLIEEAHRARREGRVLDVNAIVRELIRTGEV